MASSLKLVLHRSVPLGGEDQPPPSSHGGRRATALIVAALVLLAAFVVAAPALSTALKQGYSLLGGSTTIGHTTTASVSAGSNQTQATLTTASEAQCSNAAQVQSLVAPDITNGSANVAYPSDYCVLASYALDLINQDRAANGTGPVTLDFNPAAQQHADSMLYYGYFSHFDTQGYKPYMRYSLLGGLGADYENIASLRYALPHFFTVGSVETAIQVSEHSMIYNDSICCANGHKLNILNPLHNKVAIGVAYSATTVYFDEEFENDYISLNFTVAAPTASSPYYVTMTGVPIQGTPKPNSIYIAFDKTPSAQTTTELNNGPTEYGPGTIEGGVLPCSKLEQTLRGCPFYPSGTTVYADTWIYTSNSIDIAFPLQDFIKNYGAGVYTIYLITGSSTASALTTISIFVQ